MRKTAKVTAVLIVLGLIGLGGWWLQSQPGEPAPQTGSWPAPRPASEPAAPSGRGLLLEAFDETGRRLWRVELDRAAVHPGNTLAGDGVAADYTVTGFAGSLRADAVAYSVALARLVFRGRVFLSGSGLTLTCAELVWSGRAHSFSARGGYVLRQGKSIVRGERLWASEDFKTRRFLGATSARGEL